MWHGRKIEARVALKMVEKKVYFRLKLIAGKGHSLPGESGH